MQLEKLGAFLAKTWPDEPDAAAAGGFDQACTACRSMGRGWGPDQGDALRWGESFVPEINGAVALE